MTPQQLARFLQVSPSTILRMLRSGKLPKPLRVGGRTRFIPSDVIDYLRDQQ